MPFKIRRLYLESTDYETQTKIQEEYITKLQEQIVLLQSLCEKITQEVELPAQAIGGFVVSGERDCG